MEISPVIVIGAYGILITMWEKFFSKYVKFRALNLCWKKKKKGRPLKLIIGENENSHFARAFRVLDIYRKLGEREWYLGRCQSEWPSDSESCGGRDDDVVEMPERMYVYVANGGLLEQRILNGAAKFTYECGKTVSLYLLSTRWNSIANRRRSYFTE